MAKHREAARHSNTRSPPLLKSAHSPARYSHPSAATWCVQTRDTLGDALRHRTEAHLTVRSVYARFVMPHKYASSERSCYAYDCSTTSCGAVSTHPITLLSFLYRFTASLLMCSVRSVLRAAAYSLMLDTHALRRYPDVGSVSAASPH